MAAPRKSAAEKKKIERHRDLLLPEQVLWSRGLTVAGIDEVGAGPLAGPVVAACVVLHPDRVSALVGVDDSKVVPEARRVELAEVIKESSLAYAVSRGTPREIDQHNIRNAALMAMQRAARAVFEMLRVDHLLVDARTLPGLEVPQTDIIGGDGRSLSIAAASIVAKVDRDTEMLQLERSYPGYGFAEHKGYGTKQHMEALERMGPCPEHRRSFAPVAKAGGLQIG